MVSSYRVVLFCLASVAASASPAASRERAPSIPGPVPATVERVIDGDTIRVSARIWIDQTVTTSVRLKDVNAPEIYRPKCPAEKAKAREAKAFVAGLLPKGAPVTLRDIDRDKYGGRVVARIETAEGTDLALILFGAGMATGSEAQRDWCEQSD